MAGAAMAGAPQPPQPLPQDDVLHVSQQESRDLLKRARHLSKKLGLAQQSSQLEVQVGAQVVGAHESQQPLDRLNRARHLSKKLGLAQQSSQPLEQLEQLEPQPPPPHDPQDDVATGAAATGAGVATGA
jgi:hypothetical protein